MLHVNDKMNGNSNSLTKMKFNLSSDAWHGRASETMWVEALRADRYRLRNSPFFFKGVSFLDIVRGQQIDGELVYVSTVLASGHSTYRLILLDKESGAQFEGYWEPLGAIGCTYESAKPELNLLSVDIPPATDIHQAYKLLQKGEADHVWSFEEGYCAHLV